MSGQDLKLHYFPSSYHSLKVLTALYETDLHFQEQIVDLTNNEQNSSWFMKINIKGKVPVLKVGDRYVDESEAIIDAINSAKPDSRLVPDPHIPVGRKVAEMRSLLDSVDICTITLGVLANPRLQKDTVTPPISKVFGGRDSIVKRIQDDIKSLEKKQKSAPPEQSEACSVKIDQSLDLLAKVVNQDLVEELLDNLQPMFDKLSEELQRPSRDDNAEFWLCGPTFTAADISAAVLMFHLSSIGVASRYFSSTLRPGVLTYYQRLMKRPSVMKMVEMSNSAMDYVSKQKLIAAGKIILKVGGVIGLLGVGFLALKVALKERQNK